ncbi:MAG: hypothetical protein JNK82_09540 [Myxococcaceae bacterium]|nr:hypothetical protein [Myxococcaceae bacterium]
MRQLAVAVSLCSVLVGFEAHAKCEPNGLYVFPAPGAVIPLNAKFILEGAGSEAARVSKLVGAGDLVFKSTGDEVPVTVLRGWSSSAKRVAVILKPNSELMPNKSYTLAIDGVLTGYKVLNPNAAEKLTWRTGAVSDNSPPRYQVKPTVAEGLYSKDADGVTRQLKIRTTLEEEGPAYFLATVQRARGNPAKQVYPVVINGGDAVLGQDACSGSFTFDDGRAYKIWLETFDSAGNKTVEKLPVIEAQAPRPQ